MLTLSIVIPTYNEAENIQALIERIDQALFLRSISYEVIVIDDHSTDKTREKAESLKTLFPVSVYTKKGDKGKAQSLLEGFSSAKGEYIAMIDADLQYPPEVLPFMLQECEEHADVIIAKRDHTDLPFYRQLLSKGFQFFFSRLLLGLNYDVQSGLKVFKKEILERIELDPTPWTFDTEFLLKAKDAGYQLASYTIPFHKRRFGKSKVQPLTTSFEIGLASIALRFRPEEIIKLTKNDEAIKGKGFTYKGREYIHHSSVPLTDTAFFQLTQEQKMDLLTIISLLALAFLLSWKVTLLSLLFLTMVYYFFDLLFSLFLIWKVLFQKEHKEEEKLIDFSNQELPSYTILCPLYKEVRILPQFLSSIGKLDYPKEKLQVLLLLEEDDRESIQKVYASTLPDFVEVVIVPDSLPKTKPKACNYGLLRATGEYIVIYDAEDIPDPDQLKKVVREFTRQASNVICVQAKLSFYNPTQNLLTRFFTAEYALWFDLILPGLQLLHAPIPLGGTSNHFKTEILKQLGGWDSFNVTEDCDLGMRIAREGYQTSIIDSTTYEEATSCILNWLNQRSRWIKGYLQTYLVHIRSGKKAQRAWQFPFFLQAVVGGRMLALFINPVMWLMTISYFLLQGSTDMFIRSLFPPEIFYLGAVSLVFGNFLFIFYYMLGLINREEYSLVKYAVFIPFYWLLMSVAATKAFFQILTNPHYWAKTKHGFHIAEKNRIQESIKRSLAITDIPYFALLS